jgi:outer membrane protein
MMKRNALGLGLVLGVSMAAQAAAPKPLGAPVFEEKATGNDLKIRFIDVFAAMREGQEGVEVTTKLDLKRQELGKDLEGDGKKLEQAKVEFKAKASTMSDAARAKKEQEIVRMNREFESKVQSSEEELKLSMQQVTEVLAKEVEQAVTEIAKSENLDAVIDKVTGRVVYTSGKSDCTSQVIQSMNKNFKAKLARNEKSAASTITLASSSKKSATAAA